MNKNISYLPGELVESENKQEGHSFWYRVNCILAIFSPIWIIGGLVYIGIAGHLTVPLIIPFLLLNALLGVFYMGYRSHGLYRKRIHILRAILFAIIAIWIITPIVLLNFSSVKSLYRPKRFIYMYGVYQYRAEYEFLPEKLPKQCEDYICIAQGPFNSRESRPSLYVVFRTDSAALDEYAAKMRSLGYEQKPSGLPTFTEKRKLHISPMLMKCPESLPFYVYQSLEAYLQDYPLENAVIYNYGNQGCMLDYESGLAVFYWL
mgnify:CR=1 FL=1